MTDWESSRCTAYIEKESMDVYAKHDDGRLAWRPCYGDGYAIPWPCQREIDCDAAVKWLQANYPGPNREHMKDRWDKIRRQLAAETLQW